MKKVPYVLLDSVVVFIVWMGIVLYAIQYNIAFFIFVAAASVYFAPKSLEWVQFLLDRSEGPRLKETVFLGVLDERRLDVFYKVRYVNVYFDDGEMRKNYRVFSDVPHDEIRRGDVVTVSYFPKTRIVTGIEKTRAAVS